MKKLIKGRGLENLMTESNLHALDINRCHQQVKSSSLFSIDHLHAPKVGYIQSIHQEVTSLKPELPSTKYGPSSEEDNFPSRTLCSNS